MHALFFGVKRVHLRVLQVSRGLLRGRGLTPARFDMMRVAECHREGAVLQGKMQTLLGVSAATVSRMLKSLEELGFVTRERLARDARCVLVRLTARGLECVRAAADALVDSGIAERFALRGLALEPETARPEVATLQKLLSRIRQNYGDPAPFEHPWRAGDLVPYVFHTVVNGRIVYGAEFTG